LEKVVSRKTRLKFSIEKSKVFGDLPLFAANLLYLHT